MDIQVPHVATARRRRQVLYTSSFLLTLVGATLGLSRLTPAAPKVERAQVWVDTVRRGEMVRQVRGTGTLVPEESFWIPAVCAGPAQAAPFADSSTT